MRLLAIYRAHCPVYGRWWDYAKLIALPLLIVMVIMGTAMVQLQESVMVGLWQLVGSWVVSNGTPPGLLLHLAYRLPSLAAELLALVPWLWVASVVMVNWLQARSREPSASGPTVRLGQKAVWVTLAMMIGTCVAIVLPLDLVLQTATYFFQPAETTQGVQVSGNLALSSIVLTLLIALIPLSRYGLVIRGIATGRHVSIRESRQRMNGGQARLHFTFALIGLLATALIAPANSVAGWGTGPLQVARQDDPAVAEVAANAIDLIILSSSTRRPAPVLSAEGGAPTVKVYVALNRVFVLELLMFALVICSLSELIGRAGTATQPPESDARNRTASAPA